MWDGQKFRNSQREFSGLCDSSLPSEDDMTSEPVRPVRTAQS